MGGVGGGWRTGLVLCVYLFVCFIIVIIAISLCYVGQKGRAFAYCYSLFKISQTELLLASCPGEPQIGCRLVYSLYSLQSSSLQNGVSRLLLQETKQKTRHFPHSSVKGDNGSSAARVFSLCGETFADCRVERGMQS